MSSRRRTIASVVERAVDDLELRFAESAEIVNARLSGGDFFQQRKTADTYFENCLFDSTRCSASTFDNVIFDKVLFRSCELSGVNFIDCQFRNCFIEGGKSSSFLSFADCVLTGLHLSGLTIDRLEVQGGTIVDVSVVESSIEALTFVKPFKPSRKMGRVTLSGLRLESVGGISQLAAVPVKIAVDRELWSLFGDLLLRQMGLEVTDV